MFVITFGDAVQIAMVVFACLFFLAAWLVAKFTKED